MKKVALAAKYSTEVWFSNRIKEEYDYLNKHLIPADPTLWELDRFEDFIVERKKLIREKFSSLIIQTVTAKTF